MYLNQVPCLRSIIPCDTWTLYSCLSEELVLNQEYFKHSKPYLETNQQNPYTLLAEPDTSSMMIRNIHEPQWTQTHTTHHPLRKSFPDDSRQSSWFGFISPCVIIALHPRWKQVIKTLLLTTLIKCLTLPFYYSHTTRFFVFQYLLLVKVLFFSTFRKVWPAHDCNKTEHNPRLSREALLSCVIRWTEYMDGKPA